MYTENFTVLNEKITSDLFGIPTRLNHFIFDALNEKVARLVESGIINKIMDEQPIKPGDYEPTVLTLDHLSIWFYLGMALLLISTFFFVFELFLGKVSKFRQQKR
jgi:hypothetical protein